MDLGSDALSMGPPLTGGDWILRRAVVKHTGPLQWHLEETCRLVLAVTVEVNLHSAVKLMV